MKPLKACTTWLWLYYSLTCLKVIDVLQFSESVGLTVEDMEQDEKDRDEEVLREQVNI